MTPQMIPEAMLDVPLRDIPEERAVLLIIQAILRDNPLLIPTRDTMQNLFPVAAQIYQHACAQ